LRKILKMLILRNFLIIFEKKTDFFLAFFFSINNAM